MSATDLWKYVHEAVSNKDRFDCLHVRTQDTLGAHCFHKNTLNMKVYQLLVLALQGKKRYPLCSYDGDLTTCLNGLKFFSNAVGFQFSSQRETILNDLIAGRESTMLFTSPYGLQGNPVRATTKTIKEQAGPRSRLWTVNFRMKDKRLHVQAIFGHCDMFPMTLYEIAGVEVIANWFATRLGCDISHGINYSWFFHSLTGNGTPSKIAFARDNPGLTVIPSSEELAETLRLEQYIRNNRPRMSPTPRLPLSPELTTLLGQIHVHHKRP